MKRAFQDFYPDRHSHCFGCGRSNPKGLHLKSYWDGEDTIARFTPPPEFSGGFPGNVYGGLIASLMDCHGTASAAAAAHRHAHGEAGDAAPYPRFVTASLKVDFKQPTPLGVELSIHGRIRSVEGRKVRVDLALRAGERTCATGEMLAIRLREEP
jgi:acyl-coenzyme A thioesterase PaaI-like protein